MRGLNDKEAPLAAASGLVLVLGVAACGDDDDDTGGGDGGGEAQLDLVIGDSIPLTGDLSDFGPPGQKAADLAVAQINDAIGRRASITPLKSSTRTTRPTRRPPCRQPASSSTPTAPACLTGAWASSDTIPTAQSVSIPDGILQISPASTSRRDHGDRRRRPAQQDVTAGHVPGPDARRRRSPRILAAPRARRSTSAPATTPTARVSPGPSPRRGRRSADPSERRSSMTPSSRATTRRPLRSPRATPMRS